MSELTEVVIAELKSALGSKIDLASEQEEMRLLVNEIKAAVIEFAITNQAKSWLLNTLKNARSLETIIASMRHLLGGQVFALSEIQKHKPDLNWFRAGTLKKWSEEVSFTSQAFFTSEELNTYVIDGGKNGILGQPNIALNFFNITPRVEPVFYILELSGLMLGLKTNAISLETEHGYDLIVNSGSDKSAYLAFCKENLKITKVRPG